MRKFIIFMPNFRYFIVTAEFRDVIKHFFMIGNSDERYFDKIHQYVSDST